jgi:hypothetical protein
MELIDQLRAYLLPTGVLPLAPRQPFAGFSDAALGGAIALAQTCTEKRGMMSHAIDALTGGERAATGDSFTTIEAHFDAALVPQGLANQLVALGFELDGFTEFVPTHFTDHFTLKYKISKENALLRARLRRDAEAKCNQLAALLAAEWPDVEGYIELEVYIDKNRRYWADAKLDPDWERSFPLSAGMLTSTALPRSTTEAEETGISLELGKTADIHAKITSDISKCGRDALTRRLVDVGFYPVKTWAGNVICTAQFKNMREAHFVFDSLASFFADHGGCVEMTLEPVVRVWRSEKISRGIVIFSELPPLCGVALNKNGARGNAEYYERSEMA